MIKSELSGFYKKNLNERLKEIAKQCNLSDKEIKVLKGEESDLKILDSMSENVIGLMQLPFSIATNFKVNGKEYLIPMTIEESSVVAAASNAAKLTLPEGFKAKATEQLMIGQIQVMNCPDTKKAMREIEANKKELIKKANNVDKVLVKVGGGLKEIEQRIIYTKRGKMLILHLIVDVKDAMGANAVNSICEALAEDIERITKGETRLKILSNLALYRIVEAEAEWKKKVIGEKTIERMLDAYAFAESDIFRAVTHNKGIMNGIDAVTIATGNDFRAIEAGAHAFASLTGKYKPLTVFEKTKEGNLKGKIMLPLALGIVGGATKVNPISQIALKILGVQNAKELSEVIACVGLAQNFAALKALATEGIQKGHMKLHAKNIAIQAGAKGNQIEEIAKKMIEEGKINQQRAEELLKEIEENKV